MKAYYQLSGEEVLREVNGSEEPLTKEQVSENQKKYGPNELTEGKKKTTVQIFLEQYKDFLVIILIIAAIASGFMGDIESAAVIVIVITMNAILGTVQTVKAEASLASLKKLSGPEAKVLRDGVVVPIPSAEVTVGDIIMLEAGDYIPADGRILECASMKVDESALTGESLGVEKTTDVIEQDEVPLGDRINMVYSGSFLTYGRGSFVVTEIGMNTEVGKIASLLKTTSEKKTPLQVNLDQFGQKLSILILEFCAILFGISVFRGENIGNAFLFAVALAVAAIPEALSSIVTIVLSFGTQKMAKEHAIVRKLQAVEGLGSVSIICSDKTGTLTKGVFKVVDITVEFGFTKEQVLEYAAQAESYSNHPIAKSIKEAFGKTIDQSVLSGYEEISGHGIRVLIGGKRVLAGNSKLMDSEKVSYAACQSAGTKVYIAVDGRYAGCIVIADEVKDDSQNAIASLKKIGVEKTVMLTGDDEKIGKAVAEQLGLDEYYAQLLPDQKVEKLEYLDQHKTKGSKLAFVGDGINDAPVLARADVGIAMGGLGSDAAIEAADVVLMTDEPSKLVDAIDVAKATKRIVMQNIIIALGIKSVFLILGALGIAGMWEAVFGDVGVTIIAVLNAMRILKK